jgi:lipopolysaccharide exporter
VLSLFTLVYSASFHSGDVYKAIGRPWILTATNAGKFVLMVGPVWWAAGHSIVMVALVLMAVELLHCTIRMMLVQKVITIRLAPLLKSVLRPVPAAACMGVIMMCIGHLTAPLAAPLALAAMVMAGLPIYVLALRLTAPELVRAGLAVISVSDRTSNGNHHG